MRGEELFTENFSTVSNPSNVTGALPLNLWYMDGSTYWRGEGWDGKTTDSSVVIITGPNLVQALELGWKADNVEVRRILPIRWNFHRDYLLTGDWEKTDDSSQNHLGFHVYLSEFAPTGFVQHVKHLHVNPGNPPVGTTNRFSLAVSGVELIDVHTHPSNYIGITFLHSEDGNLMDDTPGFTVKNDQYAVDNLTLSDSESAEVAAMITHPVYISNSGKNWYDGKSPSTPWKNFDNVNATNFGPGAKILFKRGETFVGRLVLHGSGIASDPIVISAYGEGEKPLLQGGDQSYQVIRLTDNEGIEIRDLRISNTNDVNNTYMNRHGINIVPPEGAGDMRYLHFINLDFINIYGASTENHDCQGIYGNTDGNDNAAVPSRWNDMLIEGCTFVNIDGRGVQIRDKCLDITDVRINGYTNYYPTIGFVFQHNYGTNCYRNMCQIRGTKNALIQYNVMDTTHEGSAFWPFGTDGTVVQFNIFKHLRKSSSDCYVCHFDFNCINTLMQYNYGYDVEGGLIQLLTNSENPANFQEGAVARYNIGVDCGWRPLKNGAGIFITGMVDGGKIYNNTIITTDKYPSYKAISFNNWGGKWPKNNKIFNNIFYAAGSESGFNREDKMVVNGNVVSHNLYYGNISPCTADDNPITGNPLFTNPEGITPKDFKVLFGSAAISNGLLIANNGGRDYFNNAVSNKDAPTIGFHEYRSDPFVDSDDDGMPDLWESEYCLDPASAADAAADSDADQQKNLVEFALGGNPTNSSDIGFSPVSEISDDTGNKRLLYIYPRRAEWQEIDLEYDVLTTTNLISGTWARVSDSMISGVGSEGFGPGFDAVTNTLPVDTAPNQFFRLEIKKTP